MANLLPGVGTEEAQTPDFTAGVAAQVENFLVAIALQVYGIEVGADLLKAGMVGAKKGFVVIGKKVASVVSENPERVVAPTNLKDTGDSGGAIPGSGVRKAPQGLACQGTCFVMAFCGANPDTAQVV
jgi:hypothetical protein